MHDALGVHVLHGIRQLRRHPDLLVERQRAPAAGGAGPGHLAGPRVSAVQQLRELHAARLLHEQTEPADLRPRPQ